MIYLNQFSYLKYALLSVIKFFTFSESMYMDNTITNALLTSGIGSTIYIAYKTIQHYRIHSTCNQENQLVIEVVNIDTPPPSHDEEKKDNNIIV